METVLICGSAGLDSVNEDLLDCISFHFNERSAFRKISIRNLPVYQPHLDHAPLPECVLKWRLAIRECQTLIITTPVYLHNIPAILKNALEWLTTSGELDGKPVLAMTFTPHAPRGERAMKSLLWSLGALNARVVAKCSFYQNEVQICDLDHGKGKHIIDPETLEILSAALDELF